MHLLSRPVQVQCSSPFCTVVSGLAISGLGKNLRRPDLENALNLEKARKTSLLILDEIKNFLNPYFIT
jgi:hypothetical protein